MPDITKEVLEAAKAVISDPEKWTQGVCAKNVDGKPVDPNAPEAVCWCSLGAIDKAAGSRVNTLPWLHASFSGKSTELLWDWQDNPDRTHEEVIQAFDRAIESCNS